MANGLIPIRINQIVNKKPKDPVSAQDWDDILNMLIAQGNGLSDQLVALQGTIAGTATQIINDLIASGTLSLNVDATKLGGLAADAYAKGTDLTALSTAFASTYALLSEYNITKATILTMQVTDTTLQTNITAEHNRFVFTNTDPGTTFVGADKVVFVQQS